MPVSGQSHSDEHNEHENFLQLKETSDYTTGDEIYTNSITYDSERHVDVLLLLFQTAENAVLVN